MRSIRELSGQEYVHRYASDVKAELEAAEAEQAATEAAKRKSQKSGG
jgi:hypothetical protein